ncbi:MAG TPA: heme-dependent peroxidase [Bryobacteraceae bacterium]|nr:heme-dependent peroxidase [Bryobacteraceae bacterium]HOQ45667.1 heme-dependent peroxidase [Bryobacteraceae bacterium]HPQ16331.1 heme-dependent peroxidase [Bryobacteraceae bacterium]HPU71607.1 heme-dependent peroxidase [Bryobacteraceae bacterium]
MSANIQTATAVEKLPAVPLTLEGYSVLHQMFRLRWPAWKALGRDNRAEALVEAARVLESMEQNEEGQSAVYSLIGHKGDLMFLHFRNSFAELNRAELRLSRLRLADFLEPTTSYLSVIELGLYESSIKLYRSLMERGVEPHSAEWNREIEALLETQRKAMHPRLYPKIPAHRYICFYPMDRRRGEGKNFYTLPILERGRMMREHGLVGRRYSGEVQQIITGSMGFDDWEWGVDLFADDPLLFKKLIYEMRFDEVSAVYASFGSFYLGVRVAAPRIGALLEGELA